jgi:tRNA A-37 threonylcarbamoyl transferase component Bud32
MEAWRDPRPLAELASADFDVAGATFAVGELEFRTTGERVGEGGMGHAYHLDARRVGDHAPVKAVAKLFRWEFLAQLRQDEVARRYFEHSQLVLDRLARLRHLHVLPVLASSAIADNHVVITPFAGEALVALVLQDRLSPAERVQLTLGAVRGLRAMHDAGLVHGDFTLRNILVHTREHKRNALLFDFDLTLALDQLAGKSYAEWYGGRIVGAPEYSLCPEQIDEVLEHGPLSVRRDIYAVGTALFNLFSDDSVYGDCADLPSLLEAIKGGVVRKGRSRVPYPEHMPKVLGEIIDTCLERDPAHRYPDASALIRALELAVVQVHGDGKSRQRTTLGYFQVERKTRLAQIFAERPDPTVSFETLQTMQLALARQGYVLVNSLGRVKGHAIFAAAPDPTLVATGRFPGNPYRKIVTAIDLRDRADADAVVADWLGRILPVLQDVRSHLTALHKVVYDRPAGQLLLFSEMLENPRFGTDLERADLGLEEALALAVIVTAQIARLHAHGIAHNNVTLRSLLFKELGETGQVRPLFVGLVEPSFDPAHVIEDVRRLAGLWHGLLRRSRLADAPAAARPRLDELLAVLEGFEHGDGAAPTIGQLRDLLEQGLARLDDNFALVRRHGGDPLAYADVLTRHALHRHLWRG